MRSVHISGMDLNLAVVLDALLEERSVSRAGKRVGLSQSATSHALGRLRALLEDPLFVRTRSGLAPTARATSMAGPLRLALAALESSFFEPPPFDPATVKRTYYLRPSDYVESLLMPRLLDHLERVAPGVGLWARPPLADPAGALAQGQLDLLIQPTRTPDDTEGLHLEHLWEDEFIGVMRRGHPLAKGKLTLQRFAAARHALVAPHGQPGSATDDLLEKQGVPRQIAFATQNFLLAPQVAASTDLLLVMPKRIADALTKALPLVSFDLPYKLPGFRIAMFWHERHDSDPAHRFLRQEIVRATQALPRLRRPSRAT